ncbi:hypothetical protein UFOVP142_66 [uncultured Caudovirales phage]|uniref:Uncharacterized protein n=1 Tax=uncultured Caudovirales phage TaxID=2100421 RepID=A0A6J7XL67_9CAUD|nr:hypothetical protein UFOVP142_66 [uncultured Caudovirales phage]
MTESHIELDRISILEQAFHEAIRELDWRRKQVSEFNFLFGRPGDYTPATEGEFLDKGHAVLVVQYEEHMWQQIEEEEWNSQRQMEC